jgi:NAD+ kinase
MPEKKRKFEKLAFVASDHADAQQSAKRLISRYGNAAPDEADAIVALGGDGLMLQTLHQHMQMHIPIYGMNCGSVGFLMNDYNEDDLLSRVASANVSVIHPLCMHAVTVGGESHEALAINEVSLFRASYQAAKLRIAVDERVRMEELICDGVLIATPAGSTAYNLSAHGPILPINAQLLALTPISPFRPRRWRGALLPNEAMVRVEVLEPEKRPVNAVADHAEFPSVRMVEIREDASIDLLMMFDTDHGLEERILAEQFVY